MTTIPTTPIVRQALGAQTAGRSQFRRTKVAQRAKLYGGLTLLLLPMLLGVALFNYYPKLSAIRYSLYNWDGQTIEEFIGFKNFTDAFTRDPLFWPTFQLVGILLIANTLKMWPSIATAIVVNRIRSDRWQYAYRVLFVLPMVIPGVVWLLIWKSVFDPTMGVLNVFLNRSGLMLFLDRLDVIMPRLAAFLSPVIVHCVNPAFGNLWGMMVLALVVLALPRKTTNKTQWLIWACLSAVVALVSGPIRLLLSVIFLIGLSLSARSSLAARVRRWLGLSMLLIAFALLLAADLWTVPTHQFAQGSPAWLGNTRLIIPTLILWGFPWIGTVGVLIYLAGLQSITKDVYEAAEIDGVSSLGRAFQIELPLIMTQVRINLVFMTIGTLNDYGLVLLLLGPNGGPGNVGMTPGLYMYREAFVNGRFGYACALGMVLFIIILALTVIYQRYVKVEK